MLNRIFFIACIILVSCILLLNTSGCIKEYSYEGAPVDTTTDTIPKPDTTDTITNNAVYSQCSLCKKNPDYESGKWSFAIDTFNFCGNITGAVMLGARTAFTFFGPSACSADSGLVLTCYLDKPFDTIAKNVAVDRVTLRYYNHVAMKDLFTADVSLGFSLTILNYSKATGVMNGFFGGLVYTDKNGIERIQNGKFEIQF